MAQLAIAEISSSSTIPLPRHREHHHQPVLTENYSLTRP
jgi:hypothetical protein